MSGVRAEYSFAGGDLLPSFGSSSSLPSYMTNGRFEGA